MVAHATMPSIGMTAIVLVDGMVPTVVITLMNAIPIPVSKVDIVLMILMSTNVPAAVAMMELIVRITLMNVLLVPV